MNPVAELHTGGLEALNVCGPLHDFPIIKMSTCNQGQRVFLPWKDFTSQMEEIGVIFTNGGDWR